MACSKTGEEGKIHTQEGKEDLKIRNVMPACDMKTCFGEENVNLLILFLLRTGKHDKTNSTLILQDRPMNRHKPSLSASGSSMKEKTPVTLLTCSKSNCYSLLICSTQNLNAQWDKRTRLLHGRANDCHGCRNFCTNRVSIGPIVHIFYYQAILRE